ncbi:ComEC/Rec2 family competence protein, partial [Flavobacterium sp.]|uniref:ComEC/Rec2 family competence protein n=1 Tax=Flavobacterium sp. TaxID=239 RepID=UPI003D6BFCC4
KKGKKKFKWVKELLFGDWIGLYTDTQGQPIYEEIKGIQYLKVHGRNKDGFIKPSEIQHNKILEVNFVDVGQGDGCHIVTPEDDHYIIDAGPKDNMFRFLTWRYNLKKTGNFPPPMTVVISHSDDDHYMGFTKIFEHTKEGRKTFSIKKVYHNGMIEKGSSDEASLGTLVINESIPYITDLCDTNEQFKQRVTDNPQLNANYINMLLKTDAEKQSLRAGFSPLGSQTAVMELLGPVAANIMGKPALPVFKSDKGKTKNGHSVIVKLSIGKMRILLGGDLNEPAEDYLIKHYTGVDLEPLRKKLLSESPTVRDNAKESIKIAVEDARQTFQVDIAKSCHHGSSDFTSEFMNAVFPLATIISSGDEEPHCHPRPDTLGTIGKYSRGERALIFSTELSRSTPEFLKQIKSTASSSSDKSITKERLVTVYGMINVRTDGEKVIIAQKLEAPATRGSWDIHELHWDNSINQFIYKF